MLKKSWKCHEILQCVLKKQAIDKVFFCDVICAKLSIVLPSVMGRDSLVFIVFFAVVDELADHKWYWNRSWSGIYSAEKCWNLLLSFEWEPWIKQVDPGSEPLWSDIWLGLGAFCGFASYCGNIFCLNFTRSYRMRCHRCNCPPNHTIQYNSVICKAALYNLSNSRTVQTTR